MRNRRCTRFYARRRVRAPHAAFNGQTPDEMYFGTGTNVPDQLAHGRTQARQARMEANRARKCVTCA